jgi:glycerophosphoryl diester phosphodiesterase
MSNGTAAESHVVAISAHKGGSENGQSATLEAYAHAADTGAEYVEFDIRSTGDGELVVHHDSHTCQGDAVAAVSYARICALAGFEVPRVADVMRLIAGKAIGHLDLKAIGGEEEVVGTALDILGPGNFVVTSLEDESVAAIRARFPDVSVALSLGRDLRTVPRLKWAQIRLSELFPMRRIRACGADWAAVNRQLAAAGVLAQCYRNGITTMIWTVNEDKELMRWLEDSRVAVLITDRPAHAVALRAALRSGEALFQPGEGRPHHLPSSPFGLTSVPRLPAGFGHGRVPGAAVSGRDRIP